METEILFTGIGGQGVQLAAQVLARAAVREDRHAMLLGTYGGTMRGGRTDATVVLSDAPIAAPPIVAHAAVAVGMHPDHWPASARKLRADGLALVNADVVPAEAEVPAARWLPVPADTIARESGAPMAGSLVLLGALAALRGLVSEDALIEAMRDSLPSYRTQHAEPNAAALRAGATAAGGAR